MTRLLWDSIPCEYEAGVDRGVFYPTSGSGEAWNGLISVKEIPTDSDIKSLYNDGIKTQNKIRSGYFAGTIEAVSYPNSFFDDIFTQLRAKPFGMTYRVKTSDSYKIHLIYNAVTAPSPFMYEQSNTETFKWDFTSLPVPVSGVAKSSHLVVDGNIAYTWAVSDLEDILYGSDLEEPRLPSPSEIINLFELNAILRVTDNGDGTFTVDGPDDAIIMLDGTTFEITWPSAVYIDEESYNISSL